MLLAYVKQHRRGRSPTSVRRAEAMSRLKEGRELLERRVPLAEANAEHWRALKEHGGRGWAHDGLLAHRASLRRLRTPWWQHLD